MRNRFTCASVGGRATVLVATCLSMIFASIAAGQGGGGNSTRKYRVRPTVEAARAGTAIAWVDSFDQAAARARESGKPIFWYVPSIDGTFMDRQVEIDRYMMAGPFSWPAIIRLINEQCVPLRCVPRPAEAERFGLKVYQFIEPGFLIIDADQTVKLVADRLTTLDPRWIYQHIASSVGHDGSWAQSADPENNLGLDRLLRSVDRLDDALSDAEIAALSTATNPEQRMVAAMLLFRKGQQSKATEVWKQMAIDFPQHPLGWKAACEAQRIGPFARGFEVFVDPEAVPSPGETGDAITSAAIGNRFTDRQLWDRGVEFLLGMQDQSGGFFDSDYDFGGTDSLPNVYVAVTSLAGMALMVASEQETMGVSAERLRQATERALAYVADDANLNLVDRDEILWAQAYRVRFLARARQRGYTAATADRLQHAVDQLQSLQLNSGTWFHEYANAFVTATALTALRDAAAAGATVDAEKVARGLDRLESQRMANGAYPYDVRREGQNDAGTDKDLAASGGRISICEMARLAWERIDRDELAAAVAVSLDHHDLLAVALKYDNHTSTYAYGGFFFWYDMQARSEAIGMLQPGQQRRSLAERQTALIRRLPEIDGCFVDSHELGRCYGTAMALLSLGMM
jgi:hypothetical protein